jgi:hypothetical protein
VSTDCSIHLNLVMQQGCFVFTVMSSHINLHSSVHISAERTRVHPVLIVLLSPWTEWNGSKEVAKAVDELFANLNRRSRLTRAVFCDNTSRACWLSGLYDSEGQWRIIGYSYFSTAVPLKLWKWLPLRTKRREKICKSFLSDIHYFVCYTVYNANLLRGY